MTTNPQTDVDRIPLAHSVRYVARGLPDVPNQYGRGVLAPSEITLTYRAAEDSQLGRVHAYVAGRLWVDGVEVPLLNDGLFGQHYDAGFDGWPVWLAEEAQLHDPDGLVAKVDEATAILRRIRSTLRALKDRGATGFAYHQAITDDLAGPRPDRDEPDDTDLTEPDIDRLMAAGTPVQIVTAPPATFAAVSVPASAPTDKTAFTARLTEAVQHGPTWTLPRSLAEEISAAVLALLPAPADRAAILREAADRLARVPFTHVLTELRRMAAAASGSGRVADETQGRSDVGTEFVRQADHPDTAGLDAVEAELAAEAHPAEHVWAAELYDPHAEEWVPGTRYRDRDRAVNALDHGRRVGPAWKDGTPTQRRLVRATTTYTVEQPDVVSQPDRKACTCAAAGPAFAPAGHYADCPQSAAHGTPS